MAHCFRWLNVFAVYSCSWRRAPARRLRFGLRSSVVVVACRRRRRRHCYAPVGLHYAVRPAARHSGITPRAPRVQSWPAVETPSALRVGLVVRAAVAGTRTGICTRILVLAPTPIRLEPPHRLLVLRIGVLVGRLRWPGIHHTRRGVLGGTFPSRSGSDILVPELSVECQPSSAVYSDLSPSPSGAGDCERFERFASDAEWPDGELDQKRQFRGDFQVTLRPAVFVASSQNCAC